MSHTATIVRTLICHDHVDMGIVCLTSLSRMSVSPVQIVLHDDGSLTDEDVSRIALAMPGVRVLRREEADARIGPFLSTYPHCLDYRNRTAMALKLFDTALLYEDDLAYCDADVLFTRPFTGLFEWQEPSHRFVAMTDCRDFYSVLPWHITGRQGLKLPRRFNAGLMFVRKNVYDLDFVEWFLGQRRYWRKPIHRLEQTCWAALSYRNAGRFWNEALVAVVKSDRMITDVLVAGHFVGRSRYLLAPAIERLQTQASDAPVAVGTHASAPCRPWELGASVLRDRLGVARHIALNRLRGRLSRSSLGLAPSETAVRRTGS